MGRGENVAVFEDTQRLYRTEPMLREAVAFSQQHQILLREGDPLPEHSGGERYSAPAKIVVSKKRSLEAAAGYPGKRVCVLNFASATNPGGGVVRGSSAQEECLCRCSTLYPNLDCRQMWDGFYGPHRRSADPLHNDDCIYTPQVVVFKSDTADPLLLPKEQWYRVNILTCAAPNLRERPGNAMNPGDGNRQARVSRKELQALHERRLRRICGIAAAKENDVLILGAFGCGAFQNPPDVVAGAMRNVILEYRRCFETIELAVYCPPRNDGNYQVFRRAFLR